MNMECIEEITKIHNASLWKLVRKSPKPLSMEKSIMISNICSRTKNLLDTNKTKSLVNESKEMAAWKQKNTLAEMNLLEQKLEEAMCAKEYLDQIVLDGADPKEKNSEIAAFFGYDKVRPQRKFRHQNFVGSIPNRALSNDDTIKNLDVAKSVSKDENNKPVKSKKKNKKRDKRGETIPDEEELCESMSKLKLKKKKNRKH